LVKERKRSNASTLPVLRLAVPLRYGLLSRLWLRIIVGLNALAIPLTSMNEINQIRPLVYYPGVADYYRPKWAQAVLDAVEALTFEQHCERFVKEAFYARMKAEDDKN